MNDTLTPIHADHSEAQFHTVETEEPTCVDINAHVMELLRINGQDAYAPVYTANEHHNIYDINHDWT